MNGFLARALAEAVAAGALAGLVGTLVVLRRRAFFTTALTHATFPGAVVAAILGVHVVLGAAAAGLVLVGLMALITRVKGQGAQVAAGVVLTAGFAAGVVLSSLFPSLPIRVDSFLVGSILTVDDAQVLLTVAVLAASAVVLAIAGRRLVFSSFDPEGYRAAGFSPLAAEVLTLTLITAAVVTIMPAIGSILAIALLVAPAATARLIVPSASAVFLVAPVLGAAIAVAGVLLSRTLSISAGGTIALVAAAVFLAVAGVKALRELPLKAR